MQKTRRYILEILKKQTESSVDDIVNALSIEYQLSITPVTVRHHLNTLYNEGYIVEPKAQHRSTPGRPQHVYAISPQAHDIFPNNYGVLVEEIFAQLAETLPETSVNVIFEGVADNMVRYADIPDLPFEDKLKAVVSFLDKQGYNAHYEKRQNGYVLHTSNCPYSYLANTTEHICRIDMRMITTLLGVTPRKIASISDGDQSCSYLISMDK